MTVAAVADAVAAAASGTLTCSFVASLAMLKMPLTAPADVGEKTTFRL
jgi:hypothetical protein